VASSGSGREESPSTQTEEHRRAACQTGLTPRESVNLAGGSFRPTRRAGRRNHPDGHLEDRESGPLRDGLRSGGNGESAAGERGVVVRRQV